MSKYSIDRELFNSLAPKSFNSTLFHSGAVIRVVGVNPDKQLEWGNTIVPALEIEVDGNPMEVPISILLGAVVCKPDIVHNEGNDTLECIDFIGNTLYDYLNLAASEIEESINLPDTLTVIKRINKGIPKNQVSIKKELYNESYLVEDGKKFDEHFKDLEFIPAIFKSITGKIRTNGTYLLGPID